ncbi:MAG: RNA polymerase sigma factor [Planctomycetes bacterium]|nr:RNA polymerase sigma factor [Planctomycetota bacterium]
MGVITADILAHLLDQHGSALLLYARQWCDTPEDVVQEAVLQLMRQSAVPDNLAGWMYHVVRNLALNATRQSQRRGRREAEAACRRQPWFAPSEDDRLDAAAATEALARLPLEQRETIVARIWGGLSFEEISRLTGVSTSSVHRWYHQGVAALRERLGATWRKNKTGKTT